MIADTPPPLTKARRLNREANSTSIGASSPSTGETTRDTVVEAGKETADPAGLPKQQYRVPVNPEHHYNHILAWNGVGTDKESVTPVKVKETFQLAFAAHLLAKAVYSLAMRFLTAPEFIKALRTLLRRKTEREYSVELLNTFLHKATGPQHKALYFAIRCICRSREAVKFIGTRIGHRTLKHFINSIQFLKFTP